jgi:hypothetical protein
VLFHWLRDLWDQNVCAWPKERGDGLDEQDREPDLWDVSMLHCWLGRVLTGEQGDWPRPGGKVKIARDRRGGTYGMVSVVEAQATHIFNLLPRERAQELLHRQDRLGQMRRWIQGRPDNLMGFDSVAAKCSKADCVSGETGSRQGFL